MRTVTMSASNEADLSRKVAVVTGANKGLGFSIVRGLLRRFPGVVLLTARDDSRGRAAQAELVALGLHPHFHRLDVTDRASVRAFRDHVRDTYGGIDLLVNNAAVVDSFTLQYEECERVVDANYRSVLTVEELLFPLLRDGGRVLNVSSDCGHLSNVRNARWIERLSRKDLTREDIDEFVRWYLESVRDGTFDPADIADGASVPSYRVAKVALSALTTLQARSLAPRRVAVNCVHPGLVRTDMTDGVGFYSPEQAAATPLHLLLDAPQDLTGAYVWHDGTVLDWYDHGADYYFKSETLLK